MIKKEVVIMYNVKALKKVLKERSKEKNQQALEFGRAVKARRKEITLILEENGKDIYKSDHPDKDPNND
jgi:hypothetical protein